MTTGGSFRDLFRGHTESPEMEKVDASDSQLSVLFNGAGMFPTTTQPQSVYCRSCTHTTWWLAPYFSESSNFQMSMRNAHADNYCTGDSWECRFTRTVSSKYTPVACAARRGRKQRRLDKRNSMSVDNNATGRPESKIMVQRKDNMGPSRVQLDIVVVGAGLAGLAAAYCLRASGHQVEVFEKMTYSEFTQPSGVMRVSPNVCNILRRFKLEEQLAMCGTPLNAATFFDHPTGEKVAYTPYYDELIEDAGGQDRCIRHMDLLEVLYTQAVKAGVKIHFGVAVTAVEPPEGPVHRPRVLLSSKGSQALIADLVVVADGPRSRLRQVVDTDPEELNPAETVGPKEVYTACYSDPQMPPGEPDFSVMMDEGCYATCESSLDNFRHSSSHTHSVHCCKQAQYICVVAVVLMSIYAKRKNEYLGFAIFCPENEELSELDGTVWDRVPSSFVLDPSFQPDTRFARQARLKPQSSAWMRARWVPQGQAGSWIDESGTIVLIGEAATPIVPCSSYSSSDSMEAAEVLGTLFSHITSKDQIWTFLDAYESLRKPRARRLRELETQNQQLVTMRSGQGREQRNEGMRLTLVEYGQAEAIPQKQSGADDEELRRQLSDLIEVWSYDARDVAEEWWNSWGKLHAASEHRRSHSSSKSPPSSTIFGVKNIEVVTTRSIVPTVAPIYFRSSSERVYTHQVTSSSTSVLITSSRAVWDYEAANERRHGLETGLMDFRLSLRSTCVLAQYLACVGRCYELQAHNAALKSTCKFTGTETITVYSKWKVQCERLHDKRARSGSLQADDRANATIPTGGSSP
ncbi:FAD/NAD(P)-binding domain-containing protein [Fistulina hepatica ATCC 64428]|uniref:FAD/NAD(P)-binding domain-containing protein n=1 Tax=Fistulina hepatica ATCC 64428 TaxID=1128425 RepID=A0A0D7AQ25_9AGAR|nr:FAD/NAD(P)-binding domain-containing protein [Fistulina hepatica ATCC 64428]